ncbi:hypothetical protein GC173_15685 [bacterium]|nr:hypothetical protein [bacterium]
MESCRNLCSVWIMHQHCAGPSKKQIDNLWQKVCRCLIGVVQQPNDDGHPACNLGGDYVVRQFGRIKSCRSQDSGTGNLVESQLQREGFHRAGQRQYFPQKVAAVSKQDGFRFSEHAVAQL